MTILELLDKLEIGILVLRHETKNQKDTTRSAPRKRSAKKKSPKRSKRAPTSKQLPLASSSDLPGDTTQPAAQEKTPAIVGKRQALGRSLSQLRKFSTNQAGKQTPSEEVTS